MKISEIIENNKFLTRELPELCKIYSLYCTFNDYRGSSCIFVKLKDMNKVFINGNESEGSYFCEDVDWEPLDYIYCCETIDDIRDLFDTLSWYARTF